MKLIENITLDLKEVEEVDVSFYQLLMMACYSMTVEERDMKIINIPDSLCEIVNRSGKLTFGQCPQQNNMCQFVELIDIVRQLMFYFVQPRDTPEKKRCRYHFNRDES